MAKQITSQRHRPSFCTYIQQNFKATFGITEKAEVMLAIGLLLLSAFLGAIGGITIPVSWNYRVAFGLFIFILVQFGIITPFRMWRDAVWVQNIEKGLDELWDLHDEGVKLLNEHFVAIYLNPNLKNEPEQLKEFLDKWYQNFTEWTEKTTNQIEKLYPLEAKRFKNVVVFTPSFKDGLSVNHDAFRSILLKRLGKIDAIIERYQPSLLPE